MACPPFSLFLITWQLRGEYKIGVMVIIVLYSKNNISLKRAFENGFKR